MKSIASLLAVALLVNDVKSLKFFSGEAEAYADQDRNNKGFIQDLNQMEEKHQRELEELDQGLVQITLQNAKNQIVYDSQELIQL